MDFTRQKRSGTVLIIVLIFIFIFSALAVSMATISATNVEIASNQHTANNALSAAFSGMEILRYYLSEVTVSGTIDSENRLQQIAASLQNNLNNAGITNISAAYDDTTATLTMPAVTLNSQLAQNFTVTITQLDDPNLLQADITGNADSSSRTIRVNYEFREVGNSVFNYAVASRGSMYLTGNIDIEDVNVAVEAGVYIESKNTNNALTIIGNSKIKGDVTITNPDAYVILQGKKASIGGETGQAAIDNHVFIGALSPDFPEPIPQYFEQYVRKTMTTPTTTLENVKIPAGTNPTFSNNVVLRGIVFIESPNVVAFTNNIDITGIIVGDGDWTDNSATNRITFSGNITNHPLSQLPDEPNFVQIKNETRTFIVAPGFSVSLGGNFNALNGTIAANGI
jgi:Tfp pilus assembly protein PilX